MTITTEDAEAFARQLDANEPGVSDPVAIEFFGDVATALRTLAAERDALATARNDALEEAAKVAEAAWGSADYDTVGVADADMAMRLCEHASAEIRALKSETQS